MGVRPPDDDSLDEPEMIEFGIAALDARLESADLSFPATAEELDDALGAQEIAYDAGGHTVTLSAVLERVPQTRFDSEQELLDATHPVFEDLRASASTGIVARLRELVPF